MEKISIDERLALLAEAEIFFADLSAADEPNYSLGRHKAAALGGVRECLELYKEKELGDEEWTEESLDTALASITDRDIIETCEEKVDIGKEEKDFFEGGLGLAIGIIQGDEECIKQFRDLQISYEKLAQAKRESRTLADLLR